MGWRNIQGRMISGTRFFAAAAVVGSIAGAILMFFVGLVSMWTAISLWMPWSASHDPDVEAVINVIEALDRFLIGLVLLYFAYGVHSLFIRTEESLEFSLPMPLRVRHIGQLKQVVAEVIIVILFVLFLRHALEVFQRVELVLTWAQLATLLVLPVCAALLGLALKLAELHPKPQRPAAILTPPQSDNTDAAGSKPPQSD